MLCPVSAHDCSLCGFFSAGSHAVLMIEYMGQFSLLPETVTHGNKDSNIAETLYA